MPRGRAMHTQSPDSGVGRQTEPGPTGRNTDLSTEASESLPVRDQAGLPDSPEDEVYDGDDFAGIHERDLHALHEDHDAEEADASTTHVEWEDGFLDRRSLGAPPALSGMVQRWIRVQHQDGTPDAANWSKKARIGWVPRPVGSLPEKHRIYPVEHNARLGGDVIMVAGQVLCQMPAARWKAYQRAVEDNKRRLAQIAAAPVQNANRMGRRAGYGAGIVVDSDVRKITRSPRGRRPPA